MHIDNINNLPLEQVEESYRHAADKIIQSDGVVEKLLSSIQGMTKGTSMTFLQKVELAKEMAEFYRTEMRVCENEEQAKMITLRVMMDQIAKI